MDKSSLDLAFIALFVGINRLAFKIWEIFCNAVEIASQLCLLIRSMPAKTEPLLCAFHPWSALRYGPAYRCCQNDIASLCVKCTANVVSDLYLLICSWQCLPVAGSVVARCISLAVILAFVSLAPPASWNYWLSMKEIRRIVAAAKRNIDASVEDTSSYTPRQMLYFTAIDWGASPKL